MNTASPSSRVGSTWTPLSAPRHPALLAACCLCLGVFLGDASDVDSGLLMGITLALVVVGALLGRSRGHFWRAVGVIAIGLALVTLGSWRITIANSGRPSASLRELTDSGRRFELFARVDGVPYQKPGGWRVPLNLLAVQGQSGDVRVDGRVLLTSIPSLQGLRYGDYVRFEGRAFAPTVQRNPGGFDYAEYLHRQGFDATVRPESRLTHWPQNHSWSLHNLMEPVRQWIRRSFAQHLDDTSRALLAGLLLGDTDRLPKPVYDAFRESGTSHLLAISGANVWLVVGMILTPLYFFAVPRWPRTLIALLLIVLFSFLTRNEPSVVRASLMVGLILAGQLLWRPVAPLNAVGAAAFIILLFAPADLFRPGFQLSFAAVFGILIAVSRVEVHLRGFWRRKWVYIAVSFVVASVAATLVTAPISAWHFGTIPLAGIVSNLLMVPLAGLTATLGLLILALQLFSSTAAGWVAWPAGHLLSLSTQIAAFFAAVPRAVMTWTDPSPITLIHLSLALVLMLNWRHRYRWFRPIAYYTAFLVAAMAVLAIASAPKPFAGISLLDTGRQRVAVIVDHDESAIGLVDDPGLNDELDQWIVQPFLRHLIGRPNLDEWQSWRRLDKPIRAHVGRGSTAPVWQRFFTPDDVDSLSRPRVWADRWRQAGSEILMFRDVPSLPFQAFLTAAPTHSEVSIVILPGKGRPEWLRRVIEATNPAHVIFYGNPLSGRNPEETLAFWRLRFPDIKFFSSGVHGGISLELQSGEVVIRPTVKGQAPPTG